MSCAPANRLHPTTRKGMLARRGRTRARLLLSLAYAGYSGRDLALTWTAASGASRPVPAAPLECPLSAQ